MARVIRTGETPAKKRRMHMRSCAEVLRLLAQRSLFDEEAQDMAAFMVFGLRGIYRTIDESAQVWDDKNYWKKAEQLRHRWRWSVKAAENLEDLIRKNLWDEIPLVLIALIPYFNAVSVTTITRDADWWCGARRALLHGEER